jgi:hypothetical protein
MNYFAPHAPEPWIASPDDDPQLVKALGVRTDAIDTTAGVAASNILPPDTSMQHPPLPTTIEEQRIKDLLAQVFPDKTLQE